jgi:hypothetical protein
MVRPSRPRVVAPPNPRPPMPGAVDDARPRSPDRPG